MKEDKLSDQWQTPQWLFDELNKEFNFNIDLCATKENSKCQLFCDDYLNNKLYLKETNKTVNFKFYFDNTGVSAFDCAFMNPPYSNPKPFIEKAWADSRFCKIVCLVKCDPSTKWWATFWNYEEVKKDVEVLVKGPIHDNITDKGVSCSYYSRETQTKILQKIGPKPGCDVRFFPKRVKFDPPQQLIDSGEVWYVESDCRRGIEKLGKWVQKCKECNGLGTGLVVEYDPKCGVYKCSECKGIGHKELSGPTFSSALIIMNRRGL